MRSAGSRVCLSANDERVRERGKVAVDLVWTNLGVDGTFSPSGSGTKDGRRWGDMTGLCFTGVSAWREEKSGGG
jgi:hypothetical protein